MKNSIQNKVLAGKKHQLMLGGFVFVVVSCGVAALLISLSGKDSVSVTKTSAQDLSMQTLSCLSSSDENAFFHSGQAKNEEHQVKISLKGDRFSKINYNYGGVFDDATTAEKTSSLFHADYNIYMGNSNTYQEDLYPTFVAIDNSVKINLFADSGTLNDDTFRLFFLSTDDLSGLSDISGERLKKIYEAKGFRCSLN